MLDKILTWLTVRARQIKCVEVRMERASRMKNRGGGDSTNGKDGGNIEGLIGNA